MKVIVLIFMYLLYLKVSGQAPVNQIIPPSPKSQNIERFGNYPVNPSTGAPEISIPIYTIHSGELELPVTLRYHIGNIKPTQFDNSDIAFGWVLDIGGQISRVIKGSPDDACNRLGEQYFSSSLDQGIWENAQQLSYCLEAYGPNDSEYDIFNYSANGRTGEFIVTIDSYNQYQAHMLSYKPYAFEFTTLTGQNTPSTYLLNTIKMTDEMGVNYTYGDGYSESLLSDGTLNVKTTWKLKKIHGVNYYDQINFTYSSAEERTFWDPSMRSSFIRMDNGQIFSLYAGVCIPPEISPTWNCEPIETYMSSINELTIEEISFNGGKLSFTLSSDNRKILSILITDIDHNPVKRIEFHESQFNQSPLYNHTRLDSLTIYDAGNIDYIRYKFIYNNQTFSSLSAVDYWGYYNDKNDDCTRREYHYINSLNFYYPLSCSEYLFQGNRTPDPLAAQAQILKKVIFPTKGETEFIYEGNTYDNNIVGGGLRIQKIIDRTGSGEEITKNYIYENGFIELDINSPVNYAYTNHSVIEDYSYLEPSYLIFRNRYFSDGVNRGLGSNQVRYKKVSEMIGNPSPAGKTIYYYEYTNPHLYSVTPHQNNSIWHYNNWDNGIIYRKDIQKIRSDGIFETVSKDKVLLSAVTRTQLS